MAPSPKTRGAEVDALLAEIRSALATESPARIRAAAETLGDLAKEPVIAVEERRESIAERALNAARTAAAALADLQGALEPLGVDRIHDTVLPDFRPSIETIEQMVREWERQKRLWA